jgi:hypothetical protein
VNLEAAVLAIKEKLRRDPGKVKEEQEVVDKFQRLFKYDDIENISKEQFQSFLDIKENHHWTLQRLKTTLTEDMSKLRMSLRILLNSSVPLENRLRRLRDPESSEYMEHMGNATFSPILLVTNPDIYPVFNGTVEKAFKILGIHLENESGPIWKLYPEVQALVRRLASKYGLSLWQMDWVWWEVVSRTHHGGKSYAQLIEYLNEFPMHENYKPVVIKTLIDRHGYRASRQTLEQELYSHNPGHTRRYMTTTVLSVLKDNNIIRKEHGEYVLNLAESLSAEETEYLRSLCDEKINEFGFREELQTFQRSNLEDLIIAFDKDSNIFGSHISEEDAMKMQSSFVSDFDPDKISKMSIDDYAIGKIDPSTGQTDHGTFCYRLEFGIEGFGGIGGTPANKFGIYRNKRTQEFIYDRSKFESPEKAFNAIKSEVLSILHAGKQFVLNKDWTSLSQILEGRFEIKRHVRSRILAIYYPHEFLQIHNDIDAERILGSLFGLPTEEIPGGLFLKQAKLLELKNAHPVMKQWSNFDFSTFIWLAGIARSSKGNKDKELTEHKIFLTAYDSKNLEISKKMGVLGWQQRTNSLVAGDYVFVFNTKSKEIETCFIVKRRSDDPSLIWQEEILEKKLKYTYRWNAEIKRDSLKISLDEIYEYEPFRSDKKLFPLLIRNQFPRSLESPRYSNFHSFLLSKCEDTYLLLLQQPNSKWSDKEGERYEYGDNVFNYRKIIPGSLVIFRKTKDEKGDRLPGGMKFFGHGEISNVTNKGEKGKTSDGKDYDKIIAYISNYKELNLDESKQKAIENKVKALRNFNNQNAIIPIPKDLYDFIIGDKKQLVQGEELVQIGEMYEKIRQECIKRNLDFETIPDNLASKGFAISNKEKLYNVCGNILNSKMDSEIWQGITNRLYDFYDSNNAENFVIILDRVQNHFLTLPFRLLKPVIYDQKSGSDINKNFNIQRDPYRLSGNNVLLSSYADNMDLIFGLPELIEKTHLSVTDVRDIEQRLLEKGQFIFYGPPGTGKTYVAEAFGVYFAGRTENVDVVQFHPSYSYEDFIEGIRPNKEGGFEKRPGIFKRFVEKASRSPNERFVLIIDEINRGDIAKIFGELIHLLLNREKKITLTYSWNDDDKFAIPSNLYIIATMNSQDRSVAFLDYANRRRFSMKKFFPDMQILRTWLDKHSKFTNIQDIISSLEAVNTIISQRMDEDFQIGHSYFMENNMDHEQVKRIIKYDLLPLVEQYFFAKRDEQVLKEIKTHFEHIVECSKMGNSEAES